MLCSGCITMRKNRDNPLALSPTKPSQGQTDSGRELKTLRADLESEKNRTQQAFEHLYVELWHLREEAEKEQLRAVRELTARRGCQKERCSHRRWHLASKEVNIKDGRGYSDRKESFYLCSGETYEKLEQLLLTLYEKISGEQSVYKLPHRQDLELEKVIFLCHLLKAHRKLLQERERAVHSSYIIKHFSRKQYHGGSSNSCQTKSLLTYSRALLQSPHIASYSHRRKTKREQPEQPLGSIPHTADPCTRATVVDTCQKSSLEICHPLNPPHAGWDTQPPCCAESSRSDKSPPFKCIDRNMEVSYFKFPNSTHGSSIT